MKTKNYIVSIYTENKLGLLNRISSVFLKRRINIENLSVTKTETEQFSKFIIEINVSEDQVKKIIQQLEKQIEIISAKCSINNESLLIQSRPVLSIDKLQHTGT